jgi:hypothetical protein
MQNAAMDLVRNKSYNIYARALSTSGFYFTWATFAEIRMELVSEFFQTQKFGNNISNKPKGNDFVYLQKINCKLMPKIIPHLCFGKVAAGVYTSVFGDSKVTNITTLHETPSGDSDVVSFKLHCQPFMPISAGPSKFVLLPRMN